MKTTGVILLAAVLAGCSAAGGERAKPVVETEYGMVAGAAKDGVFAFLGIPFAAPPVGDLRWRPPVEPAAWTGERDATSFGASCIQPYPVPRFGPYTSEFLDLPEPSEDCLFLNVWTPDTSAQLPVIMWIHGGGFGGGSGAVPIYDGANLAAKGAVVVNINYRVGPLGFLAHPDLTTEDPNHSSGNYGLLDQVAALQWIKQNIAVFGGDPARVTIAGQSAGAASVDDLLVSPLASGLFAGAIAQSGSGMGIATPSLAEASENGVKFANYLGASSVKDLRALPAEKIQAAVYMPISDQKVPDDLPRVSFRPVIDGYVLPVDGGDPNGPLKSKVPLVTGFNADEALRPVGNTADDFVAGVRTQYGKHADAILTLYPHATDKEAASSSATLSSDRYMTSLVLWTNTRVKRTGQPVYRYEFLQPVPVKGGPSFGSFHTAEVPYLFGNLDTSLRPYGDDDRKVSDVIQSYWLNFARTGNPNGDDLPEWPQVDPADTQVFGIGPAPAMRPAVSSEARFKALKAYAEDGGSLGL